MSESNILNAPSILKTKLYPPPITPDLVPKVDLLDRLERNRQRPLTLISAPAGYGKSVLASMWLAASEQPGAWISLDETENDTFTFFSYLLAGIQTAVPDAPLQQSQTLLETPTQPPIPIIARYLMNDLEIITTPFTLVLDDIHVIRESAIFELIALLLKYPSPNLHLVLIGRQDPPLPIASLRAYRQITEIRLRDLRFSSLETAQFLKMVLASDVSVSDAVAAEWTEKTEGWVTALRLATISVANRRKTLAPGSIIQGNNHYLQEYLLAEVLAQLSPAKQACLLKTALLDRFCAPLCEVVCGEAGETANAEDFTGEEIIQWLRGSNLFLISLDDKGEWFRFHHLFRSYLRNLLERQLSSQEIATIQLRASKWLDANGRADEAIKQALMAGNSAVALDYFYQHRYHLKNNEQWIMLEQLLKLFPDDLLTTDPFLSITMAYLALHRGPIQKLAFYLEAAEQSTASLPPDSPLKTAVSGEIATLNGAIAVINGQAATHIMTHTERALEMLPTHALHSRGLAVGTQVASYQVAGNWQRGFLISKEAIINPHTPPIMQATILLYLCIAGFMEGAINEILLSASQSLQLGKKHLLWQERGRRDYFIGIAYYLRNDLANAEVHLLKTIKNPVAPPSYLAFAACALARLYQSQQRLAQADQILHTTSTHLVNIGDLTSLETIRAFQVEHALDQNNLAEAQKLSLTVNFDLRPMIWFHYIPQLTPIKLLLCQGGQENLAEAQMLLAAMADQLRPINRKAILIDVLALQALVSYAQGNTQTACETLRESLLLAEPGGFIRNYVDLGPSMADLLTRLYQEDKIKRADNLPYIEQILAAFPPTISEKSGNIATRSINGKSHLTTRELETLNYLTTELSPDDIADQMVISPATVRTHIRNIYAKLDVNGRFEAVYIAQEQGFLQENRV